MENKFDIPLTYKQLQEMLPDFVFGRTSKEDSELFTASVRDYPDLLLEIESVREVFQKAKMTDFDKEVDYRTKNLSVKVNRRLQKNLPNKSFITSVRFLAPVLGLLIVAVLIFPNKLGFNRPQKADIQKIAFIDNKQQIIEQNSSSEIAKATEIVPKQNVPSKRFAESPSKKSPKQYALDDLTKLKNIDISLLDEAMFDELLSNDTDYRDLQLNLQKDSYQELLKVVDDMDDTEIQNLIEEIKNADV